MPTSPARDSSIPASEIEPPPHAVAIRPGHGSDQSVIKKGCGRRCADLGVRFEDDAGTMASRDLNLEALNILLQTVRRHPNDWALRIRAADQVAVLANHTISSDEGVDRLLADAISGARLLRRALDRSNQAEAASSDDVAAINAWIDRLQTLLLKIIERPVRY